MSNKSLQKCLENIDKCVIILECIIKYKKEGIKMNVKVEKLENSQVKLIITVEEEKFE